jgi:hypothetical protein
MKSLNTAFLASIGITALSLAGCARSDQASSAPPPQQQQQAATPAPVDAAQPAADVEAPAVVDVDQAPPAPEVEVQPVAPGPDYIWVGGYWGWAGGRYSWSRGHYERPPHPGTAWVAPRVDHDNRGYHYTAGHWHAGH